MENTLEKDRASEATEAPKAKKRGRPPQKTEEKISDVVDIADYTSFFEYRKNMSASASADFDLKGDETFNGIVDKGLEVINAGLRKAIIWTSYKNRSTSNLVNDIFVESKDIALPKEDSLLPDAWQFGVTGRPDGGMTDFMVVSPDDKQCKYLCAVRKPRSSLGFYTFKINAGLFPPSSKLDIETCPRKCIVNYGYSRLEQVVVYFLPIVSA